MSTLNAVSTVPFANEAKLNNFKQLVVKVVPESNSAWLYFNPKPRPCYTMTLLKELDAFQSVVRNHQGHVPWKGELIKLEYCVISSTNKDVFSFGGDLNHFITAIEEGNRDHLSAYAKSAIDAVYYNHIGREFGITTISMVHGNALGGGFEAALSSNVIVAEKHVEMGLPEVLFNLFPGMGAYNFLSQRMNSAQAEKMIMSGRMYPAEELYAMGVVDVLAEKGESEAAVNSYIRSSKRNRNTFNAVRKVRDIVNPINHQMLLDIGDVWVDAAMNISRKDLRTMARLVKSQVRYSSNKEANTESDELGTLYS